MRRRLAVPFIALLVSFGIAGACSSKDGSGIVAPADPATTSFSATLGVDLSKMTRTASGLYYQDFVVGTGAQAKTADSILVHYEGWLPNGNKFDSSIDRSTPAAFRLGKVITGWNEGVVGMRVGGTRRLVIPPSLGYGAAGVGSIPGNSVLVFNIQLLELR
jgi:FKBP-type peptidyl-prolyl cis-trans isomerase